MALGDAWRGAVGGVRHSRCIWPTSGDRLRVPAAPGRRRDLGARDAGAQHRADRRNPPWRIGRASCCARFPEVPQCTSQVGRPDDGTDTTGFFNTEYFVDLKPKEEWRPVFHQNKEELIAAMNRELEKIPGVIWNFSQPISDNMEEAVSGVKGELAIKIFGDDLKTLEAKGDEIMGVMRGIKGIQDLGLFRVIGQPNLNLTVNREQGRALSDQRRGRAGRHSDRGRRQRADPGAAGRAALRSGAALSAAVPRPRRRPSRTSACCRLRASAFRWRSSARSRWRTALRKSIAKANQRYVAIKYSVRGRDLGGAVRGSHRESEHAGEAAARLSHRLGRRVRIAAARPAAAGDHHSADAAADLPDSVFDVQVA